MSKEVVIQKIPPLTCKKCGSYQVFMTDKGIRCEQCSNKPIEFVEINEDVENLIYQLNKENEQL